MSGSLQQSLTALLDLQPWLQQDAGLQAACRSQDASVLLDAWHKLLLDPTTTLAAGSCLRGHLLGLVSGLVEDLVAGRATAAGSSSDGLTVLTAVLRLLELNPNIDRLLPRLLAHVPCPLTHLLQQQEQQQQQQQQELLALSVLRAVQLVPQLCSQWRGSLWFQLLHHPLPVVRWAAVQGVSAMLRCPDAVSSTLLEARLTTQQQVAAVARWEEERAAVALQLARRWQPCPQGPLPCACSPTCPSQQQQQQQQPEQTPLLPAARGFVRVCGLEVPAAAQASSSPAAAPSGSSSSSPSWGELVQTPSMASALESAALALCQGLPLVVEGPPGCGKSSLLRALAAATGNGSTALWLHLDDQQDAKSLLGSYSCSAVPGEFVWQPGPLARAVAEGRWVVIEGVDSAPPDILAALLPLLESGVLHIPSRGQVLTAAPGFQVLGTITTTPQSSSSGSSAAAAAAAVGAGSSTAQDVLGSLWAKVRLATPTEAEQLQVLQGLYPDLTPLLPLARATTNLLQLAGRQSAAAAGGSSGGITASSSSIQQQAAAAALAAAGVRVGELALVLGRHTSTRDLIKWCARMVTCHGPLLARCLKQLQSSTEQQQQPARKGASSNKKQKRSSKADPSAAAAAAGAGSSSSTPSSTTSAPVTMVDLARLDLALKQAAFAEAADLFAGVVAKPEAKLKLLAALAALWGCAGPGDVALQYEELGKPNMDLGPHELQVGRAVLPVQQAAPTAAASEGLGCFTPTGLALRLMERIGVCLSRAEPVLLVGETGTGKTTTLTQLARLTGANLVALNMSQQTDSSDLLGGFKPVGVGEALLPLLEPFGELLRRTWKKGNNEEFLSRTLKYAQRKKWSHLLAAYKTALAKLKLDSPPAAAAAQQQTEQQQEGDAAAADPPAAAVASSGAAGSTRSSRKGKAEGQAAAGEAKPRKKRRVTPDADAAASTDADAVAAAAADAQKAAGKGSKASSGKKGAAAPVAAAAAAGSGLKLSADLQRDWRRFAADVEAAERASAAAEGGFAFAFVEGALVKALRHGWWLLLDEINLAPPEVLERIAGILESAHPPGSNAAAAAAAAGGEGAAGAEAAADSSSGLLLVERGDVSVIARHPGFRLVAAMNPATDAGKRDLPPQLRSRFTEFWVGEPRSREDLCQLVGGYLAGAGPSPPVDAAVSFYLDAKAHAESRLTDGAGHRPAYSLRTLCRALDYARRAAPAYGLTRALWDGLSMSFLTQLAPESAPKLSAVMQQHLLPAGTQSLKSLMRPPACPGDSFVLFEQFWLERGPLPLPALGREDDGASRRFVLTPSVRGQLHNLARCILARRHPILLQGPTSSGKTSLVGYLAAQTGHKFVRINNHQHTDLQEYLGSWVPDEQGRLVFREGALVTALREGHWLVLDELNLAPTEVLEALNRLLDDNRELFVPELQEVVRPHPHFMLFATQNPPGLYAGRKALSRAFRGRFLELHVEELPDSELADILHQRCGIAPSYASKMVSVMRELQRRRQRSNVFAGRHGFITPRDLFRWAERGAVGYEALAVDGFCVLGERLRSGEERALVVEVLESVLRVKLDMEQVYTQVGAEPQQRLAEALAKAEAAATAAEAARLAAAAAPGAASGQPVAQLEAAAAAEAAAKAAAAAREEAAAIQAALGGMVWTRSLKRLYTLVDRCLRHEEPVLLVGETGTGKTSVCQLLALMRHTHLHVLNCNQHTETSDFLGGFRPTRTRTRDLAHLRAVAEGLLQSPAWQLAGRQPPQELAAAAADAASPVEVEALLSGLSAELKEVQAVLQAALQLLQQQEGAEAAAQGGPAPSGVDPAAAEAAAAAAGGPEQLQQLLQELAEGGAALKAAAAAARAPFGWEDGPLVVAMRGGELLLVDELNLAEDAVLERLNSVLEPGRSLTLAEKGGAGAELVVGAPGFLVLGTMNPGGDFGKKELSPALSNRFTQIWVPAISDESELLAILESRLANSAMRRTIGQHLLAFWHTFVAEAPPAARGGLSVRDLLAWVGFINTTEPQLGALQAYAHGAYLTLLDGLGLGLGIPGAVLEPVKAKCRQLLLQQLSSNSSTTGDGSQQQQQQQCVAQDQAADVVAQAAGERILSSSGTSSQAGEGACVSDRVDEETSDGRWGIPPFFVARGPQAASASSSSGGGGPRFNFRAPTTCRNAFRLLRAMQLGKAVLLEGSPGVGKTSLVAALSRAAGMQLVRINCSEHTDMIDLLGADLPAPGGAAGQFAWCDGPLLSAVKAGHWVLLDELNLAGQSVLEGLNGLLDHRAALFVPELGTSFKAHPSFRLFAAQNPLQEGGGRKGLPKSFLNRFTRVAVELLQPEDLVSIATALHPELPGGLIQRMVALLAAMQAAAGSSGRLAQQPFAVAGGPWEFNLRDLLRWCELVTLFAQQQQQQQQQQGRDPDAMDTDLAVTPQQQQQQQQRLDPSTLLDAAAEHFLGVLFTQRLRTAADRQRLQELFAAVWGRPLRAASSTNVLPDSHPTAAAAAAAAGEGADAAAEGAAGAATAAVVCMRRPSVIVTPSELLVGMARIPRAMGAAAAAVPPSVAQPDSSVGAGSSSQAASPSASQQQQQQLLLPGWQGPLLESVLSSLAAGWMVLLVGPSGSGKTSLARLAAGLVGVQLQELGLTQGTDTSDLLGSFEQVEPARKVQELSADTLACVNTLTQHLLLLDAAASQQQQQVFGQLACQVQELCSSLQQQSSAAAGPPQLQQQQGPSSSGAGGDAHSVADTVQQLQQLCNVLHQLQQLPGQLQALAAAGPQQQHASQHIQQLAGALQQLSQRAHALLQDLQSPSGQSTAGRFEWVDGSLTKAIQSGTWVLLDNANLVNPTVLDRLNGLLEPGGVLQLDEAGGAGASGGRVVVPHPGFRLLLAYDPKHGEVSRAMRNRGVELFLLPPAPAAAAAPGVEASQAAERAAAGSEQDQEEEQQHALPTSSLALSWFQSGQADLETLLASTGVAGSGVLAAMASAHCRMARACADAHRRAPGLREAKTWAGAAGVLLQQGRCLGPALWQAWVQAYMRSYAVTDGLVAEGQAAFLALCEQLRVQAPAAACAQDAVVTLQAAAVDDMLVDEQEQQEQQLVLASPAAAGAVVWPNPLLRPCQWPVWLGLQELAAGSAAAAAARDVCLPAWLLAQVLATDAQRVGGMAAAQEALPAAQQVLLCTTPSLTNSYSDSSSSSMQQMLPQLVVTASLVCLLQPPSVAGSSSLKQQRLEQQLSTVAEAAARLQQQQQQQQGAGALSSRQLAELVQQLPSVLAAQPWMAQLQQLLPGMTQQQLLVSAMQLPQQQLGLLVPLMQQAACHAAVEAAVAAAAAQANAAGAASPYQQSVWRARHPQERARSEASHPAVDLLQPCLALVSEAEAAALQELAGQLQHGGSEQWQQQLQAVERLQLARFEAWAACHGSLLQQFGGGCATTVATEVQPERLAWAWAQLSKRMQQLLGSSPGLLGGESARRWVYLQQQMAAALQLDSGSAKPLLWRLGGHPQLPPTMQLLQAQRRVAGLAAALAVSGGAGFRVDGRGQPAALVAAGLDWRGLLEQAVAAAKVQQEAQQQEVQQPVGPNGMLFEAGNQQQQEAQTHAASNSSSTVDLDMLLEGLGGGSAVGPEAELREQLAQAAAAVLSSSSSFRHSVAQGLALLGFFPHMQLLQHQQGTAEGAQHTAAAAANMQAHALLQVADTLQEQAGALLLPVLTDMLLSPQRLQHEAAGAAAVTAALKQKPAAGDNMQGRALPARAMVSATVRQMQVDLQPLVQLSASRQQQEVNTQALAWLLQASLAGGVSTASAQPHAAGAALLQQLEGLEGRMAQALSGACRSSCQVSAAAAVPYLQLSWLLSSMLDSQQWPPQALLLQQVLPGLLHEAWFSWQAGLWAGAAEPQQAGSAERGSGFSRALPMPLQVLSSPVSLHVAAQTVAALQVCSAVAADGTSKVPRLQQLSLAVQHLLQRGPVAPVGAAEQSWVSLAALLSQLLLVHSSSFQEAGDQALLQQLTYQLLAWCGSSSGPSAADAQQWLGQCSALLTRSSHAVLAASAQELLLPCVEAILTHLTGQHQQQPWFGSLAQLGWASLLLGCARLQLVAPPSGVDPAGKYGYKADAVGRWVSEQLDPAVCVQHLQQLLPGGLDAAPALEQLLQDRQGFAARLQQLRSRCVPRPDPPQYHHLHQEVSAFSTGLADPARLLAAGRALLAAAQASGPAASGASQPAAAAAAHEASSWDGSAAAWSQRMQAQFGLYLDILQPVLLAVLEVRHGLCLLTAGSQAAQQAAAAAARSGHSSEQLVSITASLLSFPPPLASTALSGDSTSTGSSSSVAAASASMLALPQVQRLTGSLVHQQQLALQQGPSRSQAAAAAAHQDLAEFSWQLQCAHASLLVSVQELLAAGPAAAAAAAGAGVEESGCLGRVYALMQQLVSAWQSVKEFEAQAAEEAAQLFKHKTQSKTFLNEEEEAEADYKAQYPDHYAAFADLATAQDLAEDPDTSAPAAAAALQEGAAAADAMEVDGDEDLGTAAAAAAAATAAQAKSAAASSLLHGQLLQDAVSLHQQLFSTLALHSLQHKLAAGGPASGSGAAAGAWSSSAEQQQQQQEVAVEEAFRLCFALGRQLAAAQQGLLPAAVDDAVRPGCVMALALEHRALNTTASSTAAAAVAAAAASRRSGPSLTPALALPGTSSTSTSSSASQAVDAQLDMQQPFPEETVLMQGPLAALSQRLHVLLDEWPEHPLLQQLLAIVDRLLGLPLTTPLKTALTGLELLLARAQVWEETAARHVTLKQQLAAVAGLATRWRKLELASWRGLLERVQLRHAAGANSSWYHLYQLLVLGVLQDGDDAAAAAGAAGDGSGAAAGAAAGEGSDARYRRVASLVEAFMQTSTQGEFAARLQLLYSFACQLTVTAGADLQQQQGQQQHQHQRRLCNMLWNVLSYYGQYLPDVAASVESGLAGLRKELSDFVKLAKWEDRGYYAMKISTEKAQRQLHRLSRRAEDALKQPAAAVLAAASQGMGLGQISAPKAALQAAAAAAKAANKAAKKQAAAAAAAATAAAAAGGAEGAAGGAGDAAVAAAGAGAAGQGNDLAAAAAAAAEVDPSLLGELEPEASSSSATAAASAHWAASLDSLAAAAVAGRLGGCAGSLTGAAGAAATAGQKPKGSRARKAAAAAAAAQIDSATTALVDALERVVPQGEQAWQGFAAAAVAAAAAAAASAGPSTQPQPAVGSSSSSGSSYLARLPKLTAKMAKVLAPKAAAAAAATAAAPDSTLPNVTAPQPDSEDPAAATAAAAPAVQLDDLAATAASRALALSGDISKGARLRKKKALSDLLHALAAAGFSKRASDVPADDRDAAAWFSHAQPCVAASPLLQPLQVPGGDAAAGTTLTPVPSDLLLLSASCWSKADRYYFRSLARLQRLQASAKAPHKDLVLQEVTAAVGYVQHQMFLMRTQRDLLQQLAGSYTELLQATTWLQGLATAAAGAAAPSGAAGANSSSSSDVVSLPPQAWCRGWLASTQALLCGLTYQLSGCRQLLAAVVPMQQSSGMPAHVTSSTSTAVSKLAAWATALQQHKAAVQAQVAALELGGCPVVGSGAVAVLAAAHVAVQQVAADAAAATAAMAAAARPAGSNGGSSDAEVVCQMLPAWDRVLQALQGAAQQAAAFSTEHMQQQPMQQQQQQQQQGAAVTEQWDACLGQLVSQVLVAAQGLHGSSSSSSGAGDASLAQHPGSEAAAAAAGAGAHVVGLGRAAAEGLKPSRLAAIAASARQLLALLAAASSSSSSSSGSAQAMAGQLSSVLPLLLLLLGGVQRSGCELLLLHKSLGKLSYITSSIIATLTTQGYCVPEGEGAEAGEGGEGELQWQDAGGTGMGEGTGKKDVSDQLTNEDQLLGAQQKDQQQQPEQPEQQQQQGEEDGATGVEMEADFEGSLHDIDDRKQQQGEGEDEESQEGDDDRIEQQMGEVGENEERVDERLWGDEDDEDAPQDQQQQQQGPSDAVDRQQQLSVQDKSNLDYEGGGEDGPDPSKQQQQQQGEGQPDGGPDQQQQQQGPEAMSEDEGEEGPPPPDFDDSYQQQQQNSLAPQAPDQELQLPDDLNLDGGDEEGGGEQEGPDQQQQQEGEEQAANQQQPQQQQEKDAAGGEEAAQQDQQQQEGGDGGEADAEAGDAAAEGGPEQQQQQQEGEEEGDAGEDAPGGAPADAAAEPEAAGDAPPPEGSKAAVPPDQQQQEDGGDDEQQQPPDEDLEAVAAHGAAEEEQQAPEQLPQAGPQGVASAAAAPQAQATGAADQQQQQQEQEETAADAAAAPMDATQQQQEASDAADAAQQAMMGAAGATEQGKVAPLQQQGGAQQQQQDAGQQQRQQRRSRQPDANPFRNLGDALERWRADLAVQHEAMQQQQQDEQEAAAAAADGSNADEQQEQQPPGAEYQFLNQADQPTEGTTQALAPATEEQAAQQQQEQQEASLAPDQQQQQQQEGTGGDEGQDLAQPMDEDQPDLAQDDSLAQGNLAQQTWASGHKKQQQPGKQQQGEDAAAAAAGAEEAAAEADDAQQDPQQQLLQAAAATGGAAAGDTDAAPSEVAARLAATQLGDEPPGGAGLEADQALMLSTQLPPEQAEALRAQLDVALREAATAAAGGAGADAAQDPAGAAYGREMWGRCEALVAGLAGELSEQLRLILEPSLASRLGGEYRSGKRLNMKRVIGYIASQFRRDKIWMRRSRPDKRRYQVVVAVDDSRSMAENGAACFALEALALLCKAMSRLDVGELGVISYGGADGVTPLQALEVPFSDAAGPGIMSALRFDQDNTIADRPMLQLVEAVQHLLEGARVRAGSQGSGGSGSSDLRQLLLVLGDGRFHEKDALVGAVRRLVEVQGVCPVFIALDTAATAAAAAGGSKGTAAAAAAGSSSTGGGGGGGGGGRASSSLLDMQSVKFVDGKPVFERYMDTFPFPYYIVLRDIAALPATLADLLRQWFELNASSS